MLEELIEADDPDEDEPFLSVADAGGIIHHFRPISGAVASDVSGAHRWCIF